MAGDTRAKFRTKKIHRGSQVVFGERARVLTEHAEAPRNCCNTWHHIPTRACGRRWRAIRTHLRQPWRPRQRTPRRRCGSTLPLLWICVTACANA